MGVKIRQKRNKLYLDIHYNGKRTTQAIVFDYYRK